MEKTDSEVMRQAESRVEYPNSIHNLFLLFALYITLPLIDFPVWELSLSAPIFFLVAMPILLRPARPWFLTYQNWIFIGLLIWIGIFLSALFNGLLSGGMQVDRDSLVSVVRFAYWLLVFVITVYLVSSQMKLAKRVVDIIAVGIFVLGLLRLGEAIFAGAIGSSTHLRLALLSQNSYGVQFSTFFPVLLSFGFVGPKRKLAIFAASVVLFVILMNGSRSNWIAVSVGIVVFLWMYVRTQPRRAHIMVILFLLISMVGLGALLAPQQVTSAFNTRFSTLETLAQDKPFVIRQLMTQKGVRLFQSSPWIGVGVSRWRKESIPLTFQLF
jgi:hypothetical protein